MPIFAPRPENPSNYRPRSRRVLRLVAVFVIKPTCDARTILFASAPSARALPQSRNVEQGSGAMFQCLWRSCVRWDFARAAAIAAGFV